MSNFYPPVIFEVKAKATEAIAEFKKVNAQLTTMEKNADKSALATLRLEKAMKIAKIGVTALAASYGILAVAGIKAAMEQDTALSLLQTAVDNTGQSFKNALPYINETTQALIDLGFADNETYGAIAKLTAATGDVKKAMDSMSVAADLARFKHMSLADASDLLARATTGQARGLRDLGIAMGISIEKGATYEQILAAVNKRIGGTAKAFGETAAGKMAIFNAKFDQLKEQIGYQILPAFIKLVDWINKKLIPALEHFFKVIDDNKKVITQLAMAIAGLWIGGKVVAGIEAMVVAVGLLSKAFLIVRDSVLATRIAMIAIQRLPLFAMIAAALYGAKKIYDIFHKDKQPSGDPNARVKDYEVTDIGDGLDYASQQANQFADAITTAKQRFADFAEEIKKFAVDTKTSWSNLIGKDTKKAIEEGLLNPVDKIIVKAQETVNAYQTASNQYQSALNALTVAQGAYQKAVGTSNKALIASTESALKRAEALVKDLQDTMSKSLDDLASAQSDMIDAVIEAQTSILDLQKQRKQIVADGLAEELALQKDYNKKVADLQKDYAKSVASSTADAAKQSAGIIKQSIDQLRSAFKTATGNSIGDLFSGLTFQGRYLAGGSLEAITKALGTQTEKAQGFASKVGKLQAQGFSQTFIEQVIAQGPEIGGALADQILGGSPEAVDQLKKYWEALDKISTHGVDDIAKKLNSGVVLATEELTAQLAQVQIDLNTQLASYQVDLTSALSDAYTEYSDSLGKIQAKTAEQVKAIDDQITSLTAKIVQLQLAMAQLATLQAPGIVATAPNLTAPIVPVAKSPSATTGTPPASGTATKPPTIIINQNNNTNANPNWIADSTAWAIRTSADLSYVVNSTVTARPSGQYGVTRTSIASGGSQRGD